MKRQSQMITMAFTTNAEVINIKPVHAVLALLLFYTLKRGLNLKGNSKILAQRLLICEKEMEETNSIKRHTKQMMSNVKQLSRCEIKHSRIFIQ